MESEKKKKSRNRKKIWYITVFCLVSFIAVMVYAYMVYALRHDAEAIRIQECECTAPIVDGSEFEAEFVAYSDMINGIELYFDTHENLVDGIIHITLEDEKGVVLGEAESTSIMGYDARFVFADTVRNMSGRKLVLRITCSDFEASVDAVLFCAESVEEQQKQSPAFAIIISGKDAAFTLQNVIYIVLILSVLGVFAAVLWGRMAAADAGRQQLSMERIYLIAGLGMGLVFCLIIPLMAVPDEEVHLHTAYDVSNTILGIHGDTINMRAEDAQKYYNPVGLTKNDYVNQYDGIFDGITEKEISSTNNIAMSPPHYIYIPAALGLTLGRLLGLGTTLTYLLGRMFNMLMFVVAVYYAIKKIPFGKGVVFVWALLPIVLQQTSSFSYDAPIFSLSIVLIAATLNLAYPADEDVLKQGIWKSCRGTVIVLFLSCMLLLPCKGYALLPLVFLPLMLLPGFLRKHHNSIYALKEKIKPWMKVGFWGIVAVAFVAVCLFVGRILQNITAPENINNNYIEWADCNGYTVGYFIKKPIALIEILFNTVWYKGDTYLNQMLGGSLGWLEIEIPWMFLIGFLLLLVYAALRREGDTQLISMGQRIWFLLVFAGVCILALAGMLLYWTPNVFGTIEGVQGRYFLPALTLGLLALRTKKTIVSAEADNYVMLWTLFLQIFVVTAIFKKIL